MAAGGVLDEGGQCPRQRGGAVGAERVEDLLRAEPRVKGASHRVGREAQGEGAAARFDDGTALEQGGERRDGAARDDRGEVGLDEEHGYRLGQVGGQGILQGGQRGGVRLSAVGRPERVLGEGAARARESPAAGDPQELGLGEDRGDGAVGDGTAGPSGDESRAREAGGDGGAVGQGGEEREEAAPERAGPGGLGGVTEHGPQSAVLGAAADQPGGAGARCPGGGQGGPALGEGRGVVVGEPGEGGRGGEPGGAVVVEAEEARGCGDLDDGGRLGGGQAEGLGGAGQGAHADSAGAQEGAGLAQPFARQSGDEADGLLGVLGGLGGDGRGRDRGEGIRAGAGERLGGRGPGRGVGGEGLGEAGRGAARDRQGEAGELGEAVGDGLDRQGEAVGEEGGGVIGAGSAGGAGGGGGAGRGGLLGGEGDQALGDGDGGGVEPGEREIGARAPSGAGRERGEGGRRRGEEVGAGEEECGDLAIGQAGEARGQVVHCCRPWCARQAPRRVLTAHPTNGTSSHQRYRPAPLTPTPTTSADIYMDIQNHYTHA